MGNPFVHIELQTNDEGKAKEFYRQLFDWKLEEMPGAAGTYTMINVGEGTGGAIMQNPVPGTPSHWLAYVNVDDVDEALAKAQSLGATIAQQKMEIPEYGWLGVIIDPTGAALAFWQSKQM